MKRFLVATAALAFAAPALAETISLYENGTSGTAGTTITSNGGYFGYDGTQGYSAVTGATNGKTFGTDFIHFTGGSFTVARSGLSAHTSLSLDFLLAAIDSLDGTSGDSIGPDYFNVSIDLDGDGTTETQLFNAAYLNCDRVAGIQTAPAGGQLAYRQNLYNTGNGDTCFLDSAYDMGVQSAFQNIAHSLSTLTLSFGAPGQQGVGDESFAIDALSVTLNGVTEVDVPEPAMLGLFGFGALGLALSRRRRA